MVNTVYSELSCKEFSVTLNTFSVSHGVPFNGSLLYIYFHNAIFCNTKLMEKILDLANLLDKCIKSKGGY